MLVLNLKCYYYFWFLLFLILRNLFYIELIGRGWGREEGEKNEGDNFE